MMASDLILFADKTRLYDVRNCINESEREREREKERERERE